MLNYLKNDSNITFINVPFAPFSDGVNRSEKVSDHLTVGELYDATKCMKKDSLLVSGIPIHKNAIEVFELLRSYTKKPLYLGSAWRSYEWEIFRKRNGDSKHVEAEALDLNGENLKEILSQALKEKNLLYKKLRALGVNAFGSYDWGFHLDFRENKTTNDIYYWNKTTKKKSKIVILAIFALSGLILKRLF
jgi:hypothetical protein